MKTFMASLVTMVVLAAVSGSANLDSRTYISNWSTKQMRASTSYWPGNSQFQDRLMEPYTTDMDIYSTIVYTVRIDIWIEGSPTHASIWVRGDHSIVAFDNGPAIDIYEASYGTLIQKYGRKLAIVYP